ncbi:MAG: choice-of-anchor U domain-containing protein [bacterium]
MKKHLFVLLKISVVALSIVCTVLKSNVYSSQVTLAWDKNSEPDIVAYKIYYKTDFSGEPYEGTGAEEGDSPITVLLSSLVDPNNPTYSLTNLNNDLDYFFAVTAIDLTNNESDFSNEVSLLQSSDPISQPPIADAGPNQILDEGVTVQLDASDSHGTGISYLWTQISGTPVTLSDPTAANPTFVTPPVNGNEITLIFQCITEDDSGLEDSDEVTITITDNGITGFPDDAITTTTITNETIGIEVDNGSNLVLLEHVYPADITDISGVPDNYTLGYIEMNIEVEAPGDSATVTIWLSEPMENDVSVFNHDAENGWYDITDNVTVNSERDQFTITLVDGGIGDDDGVANGIIIHDPSVLTTGGMVDEGTEEDVHTNQGSEASTDNFIESIQKDAMQKAAGCFIATVGTK